jgi:hypothetical protein
MDSEKPTRLVCQGLNCSSTNLIESHIIAKGFARLAREQGRNITINEQRVGPVNPQLGYFDRNILCASCDNKLGLYDDYLVDLCRTFAKRHTRLNSHLFEMPNVASSIVAKFFLSVLWRASISVRAEHSAVSLGTFEVRARDIVFGARPLSTLAQFKLIVLRLESDHLDVVRFYTMPQRMKFNGLNGYRMSLNGFRFIAFLDTRPAPVQIKPLILREDNTLRGLFMKFEESDEFRQMVALANPMRRLLSRPRGRMTS